MQIFRYLLLLLFAVPATAAPEISEESYERTILPFLEDHCYDCHGDGAKKGGFSFDELPLSINHPDSFDAWVKVLDAIDTGEMPPKKKARPPEAQAQLVTDWLNGSLLAASERKMDRNGRGMIRRLSRREYENTVRDLLGVKTRLEDLLPVDGTIDGFDNIDEALRLSAVQIELYLEAAHRALDDAIETGSKPNTKTYNLNYLTQGGATKKMMGRAIRPVEGGVVFFDSAPESESVSARTIFRSPANGDYRVRVKAQAFQSGGKPVTGRIASRTFKAANGLATVGKFFDAPADAPAVFETTGSLPKDCTVQIMGFDLPKKDERNATTTKNRGLAVYDVEITGPLSDPWPPAAHTRLFGDIDLKTGTLKDAHEVLAKFPPPCLPQTHRTGRDRALSRPRGRAN